jgi:hypothetical protein
MNTHYKPKQILRWIVLFICSGLLALGAASAAGSPNVVLAEQNPDPVSPGNYVYLNVKVSNTAQEGTLEDVRLRFIENDNFQLAKGEDIVERAGSIGPNSLDAPGYTIVKYKVLVDEDTPLGLNTAKIEVSAGNTDYTKEFDILVQDKNPRIEVTDISINQVEPGESTTMSLTILNKNSVTLRDILVNLGLDEVDGKTLSTKSGSNLKVIPTLQPGETKTLEFELVASPDADSKPYLLPISISYEDVLENAYEHDVMGSVQVYSPPQVKVTLDSQEVYSQGRGTITLAIANPGTSSVKGTQVEILSSDDYEVIEGKSQYIGDLNPDDFQTAQLEAFINTKNQTNLRVQLDYLDSYNQEQSEVIELPLKVYNQQELQRYGIGGSGGGSSWVGYLIGLILVIAAVFAGRKWGSKRAKRKQQQKKS